MSLRNFLLQFTLIYVGLLVALSLALALFSIKSGSSGNTAALLAAVMWSCLRFAQANKRYFNSAEKRNAVLGMLVIDVGLHTFVAAALLPWNEAYDVAGALLFGVFFVSVLHALVIWVFVGLAGKQFAKHVAASRD